MRVLSVVGTRPEVIKMAPVVDRLQAESPDIESVVCATGQHGALLRQALDLFGIVPDIHLDELEPNQPLARTVADLMSALDDVVTTVEPDWVLAEGDTTSVLAASMVSFYRRIAFGHVEAGLRSGDLTRPFPEELNRRVADQVAQLLFAPTPGNRRRLLEEGFPAERIVVTGNTVIDALKVIQDLPYRWSPGPLSTIPRDRRLVLVTCHRRESFGPPLREMLAAVSDLARSFRPDVHFVYPVHLNPDVRKPARSLLADEANVDLLEPLDYQSFVNLMQESELVLTDSGGIQEEAPALGVPVLVMRDTTERIESVEAGTAKLVGTTRHRIVDEASILLEDDDARTRMARRVHPYGDGRAAERIVTTLLAHRAS